MTTVAAWADDLRAEPGLLRAWAREFTAADDVTLVVLGDPADADLARLERDAVEAGLADEHAADVLGLPLVDENTVRAVIGDAAAVLSADPGAAAFGLPIVDTRVKRDRLVHGEGTGPATSGPAQWLAGRPWMGERLPAHVLAAPTMLAHGELALLYVLARDHARENAVIDAGCFFGGSSVALAAGLEASGAEPAGRIHTYDLFVLDEVYKRTSPHLVEGMEAGDSFLPLFERTVGERLLPYLDVHAGDLLAYPWSCEPIDVLFVDIAKAWELNDHVVREFFPALVPGHSVLVQQDYVHEALPWLHITMDLFADAFELVDYVPGTGSAVFVCTRAISTEEADVRLRDLPAAEQLKRFDRAVSEFRGTERGVMEIARAVLLDHAGDRAAATAQFESVAAEYAGDARVQEGIDAFRVRFT